MKRAIVKSMVVTIAWRSAVIANSSLLSPFLRSMLFARWRHYFPKWFK